MRNNTLYIDGQVFQTAAKDRGMGRYVAELLKNLPTSQTGLDEIIFIFNKNKDVDQKTTQILKAIHDTVSISMLDLKTTETESFENAEKHNREVLATFINEHSGGKQFLIPVLFQEPTVCVFPVNTQNFLIFFDLVPYLYHEQYAPKMLYENYLRRYKYIFQADIIFTISNTVASDLQTYLGVDPSRIVNIDGAAIEEEGHALRPTALNGVTDFILLPTGDDPRKNNVTAVRAYKDFINSNKKNKNHKLVITSRINPHETNAIKKACPEAIFTGNMNELEMKWLYQNCRAVLFIPEYEGLGLPVLEAIDARKPVVCSSIDVFREISETAFYYCNKDDYVAVSHALADCVGKGLSQSMAKDYDEIKRHYTWQRTSKILMQTINSYKKPSLIKQIKQKLAVLTPSPSGLSAIGKVVAESHPALSELFDVDYYLEDGLFSQPVRPNYLQFVAPCHSAKNFTIDDYKKYDAVIYHVGNGDFHVDSIKNCLYLPGIVILHDTNLSEAYRVMSETGRISESRHAAEDLLSPASQKASFVTSIVNSQLAVICHSEYAVEAVNDSLEYSVQVDKVELPTATVVKPMQAQKRGKPVTIGLAGIIAGVKGIAVIEEMAKNSKFKNCRFMIFGFNFTDKQTTNRLKSLKNVQLSPNLTDYQFSQKMAELDIFVNFRNKYNGETSLSTLEAMRQGVVVVVRKQGWYNELPDDAVLKATTQDDVHDCIQRVLADPKFTKNISNNAIKYVKTVHTHKLYAEGMQQVLNNISKGQVSANAAIVKKIKSGNINTDKEYLEMLDEE